MATGGGGDKKRSPGSGGSGDNAEIGEFDASCKDWRDIGYDVSIIERNMNPIYDVSKNWNLVPEIEKRCIRALEKIHYQHNELEAEFFKEVHVLECKYLALLEPLYKKRMEIINGVYVPSDEECNFPSYTDGERMQMEIINESSDEEDGAIGEEKEEKSDELEENIQMDIKSEKNDEEDDSSKMDSCDEGEIKGIKNFWLTALKNAEPLVDMIQPHDEPALKSLRDIVVKAGSSPMAFTLEFHFDDNPYFSNAVLTKEYEMMCKATIDDPFFEGPEIVRSKGCQINWKDETKNLTVKVIRKTQKHRKSGHIRVLKKYEPVESFFNFFDEQERRVSQCGGYLLGKTQDELLVADFEIGYFMRSRFIPRAVLYYTGEASYEVADDDTDVEEDEEEEERWDESD